MKAEVYVYDSCVSSAEPHAGFKIAFNMFDADGNQMVDKQEFLVVRQLDFSRFMVTQL